MFSETLDKGDIAATLELFAEDCYWRDLVAFTWNVKTMEGKAAIAAMLKATLAATRPSAWQVDQRLGIAVGTHPGMVHLRDSSRARAAASSPSKAASAAPSSPRCSRSTATRKPLGASPPDGRPPRRRPQPHDLVRSAGREEAALRQRRRALLPDHRRRPGRHHARRAPEAARRAHGDRREERRRPAIPGATATARSSCTTRSGTITCPTSHSPPHWPVFTPKDKMGDWLEMYVKVMELTYWGGTECVSASFDEADKRWTVELMRDGKPITLRPAQLVFATGAYGPPKFIELPGADGFKGEILHSSQYSDGSQIQGQEGRRHRRRQFRPRRRRRPLGGRRRRHHGAALADHGGPLRDADGAGLRHLFRGRRSTNGIDVDKADMIAAATPFALQPPRQKALYDRIRARDAEFYEQARSDRLPARFRPRRNRA